MLEEVNIPPRCVCRTTCLPWWGEGELDFVVALSCFAPVGEVLSCVRKDHGVRVWVSAFVRERSPWLPPTSAPCLAAPRVFDLLAVAMSHSSSCPDITFWGIGGAGTAG